jgi:O-antigen/teichoic acid export membrane protein
MRLAKTTVIHFVSLVGKSAAGFVTTLYIARTAGSDILGKYFVIIALLAWLIIPVNGISNAMTKRISEGVKKGEYITSSLFIITATLIIISLFLIVFRPHVEEYVGARIIHLLVTLLIVQSLFKYMNGGLNGQNKVAESGVIQFIERVMRGALQIGLIYAGYELGGIVTGHILSLLVLSVSGYVLYDIGISFPSKESLSSLVKYAKYSWLGSVKSETFGWMDTIILNFFVTSSIIGIYEVSWRLASFLVIINTSISAAIFPEMSNISSEENYVKIHHLLNESIAYSGVFIIPGLAGGFVVGTDLLKIYGSEFTKGSIILLILIIARGLGAYTKTLTQTINAVDRPDIAFRVNFILISTNFIFNIVLIYYFGWYGAALATSLSTAATLVAAYLGISKIIGKPNIPTSEILKQVFSAGVMGTVIYLIPKPNSSVVYTVFLIALGAAIYCLCMMKISPRFKKKSLSVLSNLSE